MDSKTLVIIPAYNEEVAITKVISSIKKLHQDIAVVVVNDGSIDNTADLAVRAGATVLSHPFNMGYGVALQTGYKYALSNNYNYVVQIDGDGQHDPGGIKALLEKLKDDSCDIVLGSRFLKSNHYKTSIYRITGIRFFRVMLRLFSGQRISDPTTGFRAMNKRVLRIFNNDMFPYDYPDADIIMLLSKLRFKIKEVPLFMYPNSGRKSMHKSPIKAIYYIFKMLLSMLITKLRKYQIPGE